MSDAVQTCTAFSGLRRLATGSLVEVATAAKAAHDAGEPVLVFSDLDARPVEFDLRGDLADVLARLRPVAVEKRGPGRPKLGVAAREVTLLPRHWDWLAGQPGGASVTLRKLVEAALREADGPDSARRAKEAAYRFKTAVGGDLSAYEQATRTLFAGDWTAFDEAVAAWPADVRDHARRLAEPGWRNGQGRPA